MVVAVKSVQKEENMLPVGGLVLCDEKFKESKVDEDGEASCFKVFTLAAPCTSHALFFGRC